MNPHEVLALDPSEGDVAPEYTVGPITRTDIVKYAGASGDFTRLHHDESAARDAGFSGVFAMGMLSAGVLGHFVGDWLGYSRIREYDVRFIDAVWPGETLVCHGAVTDRYTRNGETQVDCDLEVTDQDGTTKTIGEAIACLDDPVKLPDGP